MIAEGRVTITLPAEPGGPVDVRYRQAFDIETLLRGKPADSAARLVPSLFAVCEHAHRQAAVQALGEPASRELALLTAMETLREHVLRIALDWAEFLGEPAPSHAARTAAKLVREMACAFRRGAAAEPIIAQAERLLESETFAAPLNDWLAEDTADWAARGETLAARMIAKMIGLGWVMAGSVSIADGRDATIYARRADDAKLRGLGCGIGARMAARLVELARLPDEMRAGAPAATSRTVAAARGPLSHAVKLRDGVIARYSIATPTELNFAPDGVAARGLAALDHPDRETRMRQARLLVNAVDPCVGFELEVADA